MLPTFKLMTTPPLCIDLDGTLIHTDMLHESAFGLLKSSPWSVLKLPWVLLTRGKAALKQWMASKVEFDASVLPYHQDFLAWLRQQHASGRRLVLCTASDRSIANAIASHLGVFEEVMASDGAVNLEGRHKAQALVDKFGKKGFDYAGNSVPDLEVWQHARKAIVVNASAGLISKVTAMSDVEVVFERPNTKLTVWLKALRVHQWLKNGLLLVPLLAAHQLTNGAAWLSLFWAFVAFSLCASSVYIANDLMDLESDRQHPRKRNRPFASGALAVYKGAAVAPLLFLLSCFVGAYVGPAFLQWLLIYFLLTCVYSVKLKQLVLVDCMTLAILYTLRIVAGAAAVGSAMSFWLLAFSIFLFLSLAFIKRFAELQVQLLQGKHKAHGRGYFTDDAPLIQMLGIASGFMSVLVLALYLNSPEVQLLYVQPAWVWGNVPVMVFWVSWLWLRAHRGEMHDDPLIFAVKDKMSLVSGVLFAGFLFMGSLHA
jgi:4-hydroxybenzoate polyprenyltransferase/phosphoserine phosphatase